MVCVSCITENRRTIQVKSENYWANAIAINKRSVSATSTGVERRFTYSPVSDIEKAKEIIREWAKDYILLVSWIQKEHDLNKYEVRVYEENVSNLQYGTLDIAFERREGGAG